MVLQINSLINNLVTQDSVPSPHLEQRTVAGLHDHVLQVIDREAGLRRRTIDLGAGSGALGVRLRERGFDVLSCDAEPRRFGADLPFQVVDLDQAEFAEGLGVGMFDLVTATEVIEHVEAPISFLRNISRLLAPDGIAVVTTPNVDSLPARVKFLLKGKLRLLDEYGDPTHISPVFMDLLIRMYLPRSGLTLLSHETYPADGFIVGRQIYRQLLRPMSSLLARRPSLAGDNHIFVLKRTDSVASAEPSAAVGAAESVEG